MNNMRLIKTVLLGAMEGQSQPRRPERKWIDKVKEWCSCMDVCSAYGEQHKTRVEVSNCGSSSGEQLAWAYR